MTTKRFELYDVGNGYFTYCGIEDNNKGDCFENMEQCCDKMNALHEENQKLQKVIVENKKLTYNENERLRNKNKRLHKDWDKLYELCREHLTDEEIIKELGR